MIYFVKNKNYLCDYDKTDRSTQRAKKAYKLENKIGEMISFDWPQK